MFHTSHHNFSEEQGGDGCGMLSWIPYACLARRCSGNENKLLPLRNTLVVFGQPDTWHKQKFKTAVLKLCLHSIRSLLCFPIVLMMLTGKVKVHWFIDFRGSSDFSGGRSWICSRRKYLFLPLTPKQAELKTQLRSTSSNSIIYWGCQDERLKRFLFKIFSPNYYPSLVTGHAWG